MFPKSFANRIFSYSQFYASFGINTVTSQNMRTRKTSRHFGSSGSSARLNDQNHLMNSKNHWACPFSYFGSLHMDRGSWILVFKKRGFSLTQESWCKRTFSDVTYLGTVSITCLYVLIFWFISVWTGNTNILQNLCFCIMSLPCF